MSTGKRKRHLEFQVNSATDQGNYGKDLPPWALEVPMIFQRIMSYLSVPDILHNCSLVNKFWCHEARTFLRDKRTCTLCTALIRSAEDAEAVEKLMNSHVIPFNRISVYCPQNFGRGAKAQMVQLEQQIMQLIEMIRLKSLYIYEDEKELRCDRRMSRNIIEQALRKKSGMIEEVLICYMPDPIGVLLGPMRCDFASFFKGILTSENFSVPVLRTLAFHREQRVGNDILQRCVLPIIAIAPKLQNVFLTVPFIKPFMQHVSPSLLTAEHVNLCKRFRFDIYFYNQEEWNWLLTNMELECKHLEVYLVKRWGNEEHQLLTILELLRPFLTRNQNSITFLVTDVRTILILQQNDLLELFPRLKHLRIKAERLEADQREQVFPIVSNFSQTFPELLSVGIENQHDQHSEFNSQFPIMLDPISTGETPVPQNGDNTHGGLKELILRECYDQTIVETWATMLPEIEHLVISAAARTSHHMDLTHIWRCWPSLVSLEINYHHMNAVNFSSTVCGLRQAEIKILGRKTMEELKQVAIVRTRPSITGMTNLKELRVNVISERAYWNKMKCPVPKISQALAFGRMENLKVQFQYIPKYRLNMGSD